MNRIYQCSALAGIAVSIWGLLGGLAEAEPKLSGESAEHIGWISTALHERGLRRRVDVVIEIDASEVAAGFSRVDCDGLLLVATLPHTAQGWGHIAPRLDLSGFTVGYAYDGVWRGDLPRLQRLNDRLMAELRPGSTVDRPRLIAVAEAGNCDLSDRAETTLLELSLGGEVVSLPEEQVWNGWSR